jgi:hypothetical protein
MSYPRTLARFLWYKTAVPVFLERAVIAFCVTVAAAMWLANPMNFDTTQKVTLSLSLLLLAYFAAHTVHRSNQAAREVKPASDATPPQSAQSASPSPGQGEQSFADDIDELRVTINDTEFWGTATYFEKYGIDLDKPPAKIPGRFYVEARKPYFDGKIRAGEQTVEIRRNRILSLPKGWDENSNDRAYEVVNDKLRVVFQFVLESAEHVEIDAGQYINNDSMWRERIFRYPSSQHPGELVPGDKLKPLTVKTLYQFFLEDCKGSSTRSTGVLGRGTDREFQAVWTVCRDLDTRSAYMSVFIPQGNPEPAILAFAAEFQKIIDNENRSGLNARVHIRPGDGSETGKDVVFTGLVIIYYTRHLFDHQIESLTKEFEKRGAHPRFHGPDYEVTRNSPLYGR